MEKTTNSQSTSLDSFLPKNKILTATNLSHSFDYQLFEKLNLDLYERQSVAILGVSGSGKSTLLHILATLLKPDRGQILYKEASLYRRSSKELLEIRRKDIGIIFQSHYLFKGFTTKENLEISSIISQNDIDMELLEKLDIVNVLNSNIANLSGGQQQRVSIARVLMKKPKLIFADEPTGNLDAHTAGIIMDVMLEYIRKVNGALFVVTHDEKIAQRCDNIYKLKDKRLMPVIF
jgi:putative ABC transport system ATP-binding protein